VFDAPAPNSCAQIVDLAGLNAHSVRKIVSMVADVLRNSIATGSTGPLIVRDIRSSSLDRRTVLTPIALIAMVWVFSPVLRAQDEFVGPFASWANAKTQYGAVGDGKADDTAALQHALNDLGTPGHSYVLFLPAGTYRITATLQMTSQIWVSVLGVDPNSVTIRWDGPSGGTMLLVNGVRFSRWGRITWDGSGRALTAVHHQWDGVVPGAATGNEHMDEVFQGVSFGLRAGNPATNFMDSEMLVIRCKFVGCSQAGVSIESWNALDWFIWYSDFENCNIGVTNQFGAGNFHVYYSKFANSTVADVTIQNTVYFALRGNFSTGSRKFYSALGAGQNSAQVTLEHNTILDTSDNPSVLVWDLGPFMLFDNIIRSLGSGPAVQQPMQTGVENVSVGNTFTVQSPVVVASNSSTRASSLDDQIVPASQISAAPPVLPGTPPNLSRTVFEVPVGSSASQFQDAINRAVTVNGQKPVVHLPAGNYQLNQTIVVPAGSDVQIVGDGQATKLCWSGVGSGPVLHLVGPSKATLSEFAVEGQGATGGIAVDNADQAGARVFGQMLYFSGSAQYNILSDHLNSTLIEMRGLVHTGLGINSVSVIGGDQLDTGRVNLFGGASSSSSSSSVLYDVRNGGRLLVQDMWYEGSAPRVARLNDRGSFTLHEARVAPSPSSVPAIEINGFHGPVTLAGVNLNNTILATNAQSDTNILLLGLEGHQSNYVTRDATVTNFGLLNSHLYDPQNGSLPIPNQGSASPAFVRSMLASTRTETPNSLAPLPAGVTDVKMYHLAIENTGTGLDVSGGGGSSPQCTYSVTASASSFSAGTGSGTINIGTGNGCSWNASSNAGWLTLTSPAAGTGSGTVQFSLAANSATTSRSASLSVGSQSLSITQAGACAYSLSSSAASVSASSSTGALVLSTGPACAWTATSDSSWLTVSPGTGSGSTTLTYAASANAGSTGRSGHLLIAQQTVLVSQAGSTPGPQTMRFQQDVAGYSGAQDRSITDIYLRYNSRGGTSVNGSGLDIRNMTTAQSPYESRELIRFGNLTLPAGATVISAKLTLTLTNWQSNAGTLTGYYILPPWNPATPLTATWTSRDTGIPWAAPGASGVGTDILAGKSFQISGLTSTGDQTVTVELDPAVVQNWVRNPATDQGVIITNPVPGWVVTGYSSRSPQVILRPVLTITYQ